MPNKITASENPAALVLEMVGREEELSQIRRVVERTSNRPAIVFITGHGGVGKTRLLKEAVLSVRRSRVEGRQPPDSELLVDFYHMQNHAVDHFVEALYRCLPDPGDAFGKYVSLVQAAQRSATPQQRQAYYAEARDEFVEALTALGARQPVVLGLDTLERLVYELDGASLAGSDRPRAWRWLVDRLPQLGGVTFVMAGRERSVNLREELAAVPGLDLFPIDLRPLDEEHCWAYLEAAASECHRIGAEHAAEVIEGKLLKARPELQSRIYQYTQGSPILLALMVDYLSLADDRNVQALLKGGIAPYDWEKQLIQRLMDDIKDGDVIYFMGYLPKGVDLGLISEVMETPPVKIAPMFNRAARFSFVKPAGGRLYLHDELYKLFEDHHLLDAPGTSDEAAQVERGIARYYDAQIEEETERIRALYRMIESEEEADLTASLAEADADHERSLADNAYYRLRQNTARGFARWYRYVHEAALSANYALDIRLELEMISFLLETEQAKRDIDPDLKRLLQNTLKLGAIRRTWAYEQYQQVIDMVSAIRQPGQSPFGGDPILEALLNTWEAYARIIRGQGNDLFEALTLLDQSIASLSGYENCALDDDDARMWLGKMHLAFAYRVRGYARRVQGLIEEAITNYQHALVLFQQTNVRIEIAYTQNDLSFALAEVGRYDEAIVLVRDALRERYALGIGAYIGLSQNTLGSIYIRQGKYDEAIRHILPALHLFHALEYQRGEGLALNALAEAKRRKSSDLARRERAIFLDQALRYAQQADAIFKKLGEVSRRVESLIEIGCAHRDWVLLCRQSAGHQFCDQADMHLQAAQSALEEAARQAKGNSLYRYVDALVNLAWLRYFYGDLDGIETYVRELEDNLPEGYWIDSATGEPGFAPDDPAAQRSVWPQLAKLYVLRGHTLLQRGQSAGLSPEKRQTIMRAVGEMYALAMVYDLVFGPDHYGMRRARADIRHRLELLHGEPALLRAIAEGVIEAEDEFHLEPKARTFLKEAGLWLDN